MGVINVVDMRGGYCLDVPPELMEENEASLAENCNWRNGIKKRNGIITYSTTDLSGFTGLKGAIRAYINDTWYTIIALDDGSYVNFYAGTGTTFAAIDNTFDWTTGYNVEFAELLGHVVAVNGVDKPAVIYWDSALTVENLELHDIRTRDAINWWAGQWDDSGSGYTYGYQELGLTGITNGATTGLTASTQYYFKVNVDGGGVTEYDITLDTDTTYLAVLALMNAEISGATFTLIGGDVRCTSDSTGSSSTIAMSAGTSGTDLFGAITGFTAFETAVAGLSTNFIDDYIDAQDAGADDFQLGNTTANDGFYISCDFTFNRVVFSSAEQAGGSPVAEYMYWNGTAWTTLGTLVTTPSWTAAAGDRTLEFNLPLDSDGLLLWKPYEVEEAEDGIMNKFVIRVRFTTAASAAFSCDYLSLYNTQYLTQILQDGRPHLVCRHNNQIYLAEKNIINFSPPNQVTGWREGQAEYFVEGGEKITGMVSQKDALVVFKENTIYTFTTTDISDPVRSSPLTNIGCIAPRTPKLLNNVVAFLSGNGIYLWDGTNVSWVSKHIRTDIDSYTLSNACAVVYGGEYMICFPSASETLVFDPDTYRLDKMGDGRVSFFKYTGYLAHIFLNCDGFSDTGYLLACVDQATPYIARCDTGTQDNIGSAANISMVFRTKYKGFENFQTLKLYGILKMKFNEVSAHDGERHIITLYRDDERDHVHVPIEVPKGTMTHSEEIRMPYLTDGDNLAIEVKHNRSTLTTFLGYSIYEEERRF